MDLTNIDDVNEILYFSMNQESRYNSNFNLKLHCNCN